MTAVVAFALIGFGVWMLLRPDRPGDKRRDARGGPVLDGVGGAGDGPAWSGGDCGAGDGGGG